MSDPVPYILSSAAWLVAGSIISAVWMRVFYHRLLVREGKAAKEPSLSVFVAIIVGLMAIISALYSASTSLTQHHQGDQLAATAKTAASAAAKAKTLASENHQLTLRNQALANCINAQLRARNQSTLAQSRAEINAFRAVLTFGQSVTTLIPNPHRPLSDAERAAVIKAFEAEAARYPVDVRAALDTLQNVLNYRANHPLGSC